MKTTLSNFKTLIIFLKRFCMKLWGRIIIILLLLVIANLISFDNMWALRHKTDWFHDARWGVMTHYLTTPDMSSKDWNERVNNFDVKGLAKQLKSVGAKYYMISIGQNSGHYCAPNSQYNFHTKIVPSKCSRRDLISDIYDAIHPFGIKLMVYLPAGAPGNDGAAVGRLEWTNGANRNRAFQVKWESVIREWSLRWGKKVSGWWFDGVYWPKEMYDHDAVPNFRSFAAAAKAGNTDSIVAFNPGPKYPVISLSRYEDYTAGETNEPLGMDCDSRWIGNAQFHVLSYLGSTWSEGTKRYTDKHVIDATNKINKCNGVITWDVPIQSDGNIPKPFVDQMLSLQKGQKTFSTIEKKSTNLAMDKKARLLDEFGIKDLPINSEKHFPALGVDGDFTTFALAGNEWSWAYQVDLDKTYPISRISVTFGPTFATEYKIFSSKNGVEWSIIKHEKSAHGGKYNYKIKRTLMRYLKIQSVKPNAPNQLGKQMSIAEVEAYK